MDDKTAEKIEKSAKVIEIENKPFVASNRLIEANYRLTLAEQKVIIAIITQLDFKDKEFNVCKISIQKLAKFCGFLPSHALRNISSVTDKIMERVLQIHIDENTTYKTHWVQSCLISKDKGFIIYKLDSALKPELLQLKGAFVSEKRPQRLMQFDSFYTTRFYLLFKQYIKIGVRKFTPQRLVDMFELPPSYALKFSNLKNKVINVAIKELNKKSDIEVEVEYKKEARRGQPVKEIIFSFTYKDNYEDNNDDKVAWEAIEEDLTTADLEEEWKIMQKEEQERFEKMCEDHSYYIRELGLVCSKAEYIDWELKQSRSMIHSCEISGYEVPQELLEYVKKLEMGILEKSKPTEEEKNNTSIDLLELELMNETLESDDKKTSDINAKAGTFRPKPKLSVPPDMLATLSDIELELFTRMTGSKWHMDGQKAYNFIISMRGSEVNSTLYISAQMKYVDRAYIKTEKGRNPALLLELAINEDYAGVYTAKEEKERQEEKNADKRQAYEFFHGKPQAPAPVPEVKRPEHSPEDAQARKVWDKIVSESGLSEQAIKQWLKSCIAVSVDESTLTMETSDFAKTWIEDRYKKELDMSANNIMGDGFRIIFTAKE